MTDQSKVVLINTFVVPIAMEESFLSWWRMVRPMFAMQPGFISAKLHRSLDQKERYRFINIAEWEGSELYRQALSNMVTMMPKPSIAGLEWHPALYEVVAEA
ncbi:MAG: antibiotic biosynthesis monooxygenase family protein [Neomegalonema sp.]